MSRAPRRRTRPAIPKPLLFADSVKSPLNSKAGPPTTHCLEGRQDLPTVWLRVGFADAPVQPDPLRLLRRLNRYLSGSGLAAVSQGDRRILLMALKGIIAREDLSMVMLWLRRQHQVSSVGVDTSPTKGSGFGGERRDGAR